MQSLVPKTNALSIRPQGQLFFSAFFAEAAMGLLAGKALRGAYVAMLRATLASRSTDRRAPLLPSGCPLGLMDKASDF